MKKIIGKLMLDIVGWKLDNHLDLSTVDKCILVCAPHTSNWDFYYTIAAFWQMDIPMKLFIKDAWTKPWYGSFIKKLGGIGIDRTQRKNMVEFAADILKNENNLYLINTPEGTRSFSPKWKTGFYYIAKEANVPILLGYCNYKEKKAGISKVIYPNNYSLEEIMIEIENFFKDITPKYLENFNKKIY